MSHVDRLRRLAAERVKPLRYPICLDPELRQAVDAATADLEDLHATLAELDPDAVAVSLGQRSPRQVLQGRIEAAEGVLVAAEAAAADSSVVLIFRWLDPDERDALMGDVAPDGSLAKVYARVASVTYERTEASDGEDVGWSFAEAWKQTNSGDRQRIYVALVDADLTAQTLPFDPANCGRPATSSRLA